MKPKKNPTTVRLTENAAQALDTLSRNEPKPRSQIVEEALLDAIKPHAALSNDEKKLAAYAYRHLLDMAGVQLQAIRNGVNGASANALALQTTAALLKRIIMVAQGRVVVQSPSENKL